MALWEKQQNNSKHKEYPKWMLQSEHRKGIGYFQGKDDITILAYPDISKPFAFHTDSCQTGLSAVLYQCEGVVDKVIAYASIGLSRAEKELFLA